MADDEDVEMDPALAEAMGFSGFGMANKKRKYNPNDAFLDAQYQSTPSGTGANNEAIADRSTKADRVTSRVDQPTQAAHREMTATTKNARNSSSNTVNAGPYITSTGRYADGSEPSLEALRNGVRNEQGDMVYFMPSFLEDPWKDLRPK